MDEGDNLFPNIVGMLCRFRLRRFGVTADVEKAFLQVALENSDRNFVRFLWYSDLSSSTIVPFRFTRLVFGVRASPFLLSVVIQHQLLRFKETHPWIVSRLLNNIYVDDVLLSVDSVEQLHEVKSQSCILFRDMQMNLRKWHSSDSSINDSPDDCHVLKVFGLLWNSTLDSLSVCFSCSAPVTTKRQLASLTCSLFDPLGFFSPFVLRFKLLLREVWSLGAAWDDPLPQSVVVAAAVLVGEMPSLVALSIPRWLRVEASSLVQIHGFGDASPHAYGCAIYLVVVAPQSSSSSMLIASKTRLSPSRSLTIPKLELLASLITVRLVALLSSELCIEKSSCYAWSDSKVCLAWIQSIHKTYKDFVGNRVSEIRTLLPLNHWNYVPTDQNPSDFTTRAYSLNIVLPKKNNNNN